MSTTTTIVATSEGRLRGRLGDGLVTFRNVPFAAPPTQALRFMPPQSPQSWSGVRDALADGSICPQLPARLAMLMGPIEAGQDEDCLTLTIWAPESRERSHPVLVWFHGGGYASGAGSLPWYSGERLAREHGIVVVGVNYRVGALGYFHHPALVAGNMGLLDQIAALRWILRNVAQFGGDPECVTLMGQSGGAHSIACLMSRPETRPLVRRGIFLSAPFGMRTIPARAAAEAGAAFLDALQIDAGSADALARLQRAPVSDLLQAQLAVMRRPWRPAGDPTPPFGPAAVNGLPEGDQFDHAVLAAASRIDALLGTTHDEMSPFYLQDPRVQNAAADSITTLAANLFGGMAGQRMDAAKRAGGGSDLQAFCHAQNVHYFMEGADRLARAVNASGRRAWVYRFDWPSPNTAWGACHCIELPFVFGSWQGFARAPMLGGAAGEEIEALSVLMRAAIGRFVICGDPNGDGLPQWPTFDDRSETVLRFDRVDRIRCERPTQQLGRAG